MIKLLLTGLALFSTLGFVVAREVLIRLGLELNYLYVALGALAITLLLLYRGALLILLVAGLTLGVNLPDSTLLVYGIDKDLLMAVLLVMIMMPLLHRAVQS